MTGTDRNDSWGALVLGPSCANACVFCEHRGRVPPAEQKAQLSAAMANILDFKRRGIRNVEISGADPVEYEKLPELIAYLKKLGFGEIQVSTHGRGFGDAAFLGRAAASGLTRLRIPLYGSKASVHDAVTGARGSFRGTWAAVKNALKLAPRVSLEVSTLVTRYNAADLKALARLCRKAGVASFYVSYPCIKSGDLSYYLPLKDAAGPLRELFAWSEKAGFPFPFREIPFCVFGRDDARIDNRARPPDLGASSPLPEKLRGARRNIPAYREKRHAAICARCRLAGRCDGFFANDLGRFGTGRLRPLRA